MPEKDFSSTRRTALYRALQSDRYARQEAVFSSGRASRRKLKVEPRECRQIAWISLLCATGSLSIWFETL